MKVLAKIVVSRLLAALLLAVPAQALAQTHTLNGGDEVRVRWRFQDSRTYGFPVQRSAVGVVVDYTDTHIMLNSRGRIMAVPMSSVRTVEKRVGTQPASAPAMVMGSGIGFAAGFLAGAALTGLDRTSEDGDGTNRGISVGVLLGAPIGALVVYAASRSRGIYEVVDMPVAAPSLSLYPSGRVGLSVRLSSR